MMAIETEACTEEIAGAGVSGRVAVNCGKMEKASVNYEKMLMPKNIVDWSLRLELGFFHCAQRQNDGVLLSGK